MNYTKHIRSLMSGEMFRKEQFSKHYRLLGLLAVYAMVYITAGYQSARQQHELSDLKKDVRDAKFEYLTVTSQRVDVTRQSQIVQMLSERDSKLKENRKPLVQIER